MHTKSPIWLLDNLLHQTFLIQLLRHLSKNRFRNNLVQSKQPYQNLKLPFCDSWCPDRQYLYFSRLICRHRWRKVLWLGSRGPEVIFHSCAPSILNDTNWEYDRLKHQEPFWTFRWPYRTIWCLGRPDLSNDKTWHWWALFWWQDRSHYEPTQFYPKRDRCYLGWIVYARRLDLVKAPCCTKLMTINIANYDRVPKLYYCNKLPYCHRVKLLS